MPVASAIVTGIIGAGALKSIISDYNKLQLKDFYSYGKAIAYVYDEVEKKYLDMYDDFIAELRVKVEKYLIECVGANDGIKLSTPSPSKSIPVTPNIVIANFSESLMLFAISSFDKLLFANSGTDIYCSEYKSSTIHNPKYCVTGMDLQIGRAHV